MTGTPALQPGRVSIIVPCRNERAFIERCLDSIVGTDFPTDRLEVWVVDGMSDDGTREVLESYAHRYPFIHVVANPARITAAALNLGIRHSSGATILWMSAHNDYPTNYISTCVEQLERSGADNVGGAIVTVPRERTLTGIAIVAGLSHRFGVGNSYFRIHSNEPRWVDTVFGGAYRREVFEDVGLFNEQLVRGQDMEFNLRLKRAGKRTLLVPGIVSHYYARTTLPSFWKHNWANGFWAIKPFQYSEGVPVSWRHLAPLALIVGLIGTAMLGLVWPSFGLAFIAIAGAYSGAMLAAAFDVGIRQRNARLAPFMPVVFLFLHIPYGLGSLAAALNLLALGVTGRLALPAPPAVFRRLPKDAAPPSANAPTVSIVIPCRREARHIRSMLESVLQTTYPGDRLEILLVDGMSEDGTREIAHAIARTSPFLRLLDNPSGTIPAGLNIGVREARGDIVIRMDAHTTYPPEYISGCVKGLIETGADCVGGSWVIIPTDSTPVGHAIAAALAHPFGVGNAHYRFGSPEPLETDAVPFGCMWRERMLDLGPYDERFARSEDIEFTARLRALGGRIVLLPSVRSFYHARSSATAFARHNLSNGFWAIFPIAFGPLPMQMRHKIPLLFILCLTLPALASLWWKPFGLLSLGLATLYVIATLGVTVAIAARLRSFTMLLTLPLAFALLHVPYGIGSAAGLGAGLWRRLRPSPAPVPGR